MSLSPTYGPSVSTPIPLAGFWRRLGDAVALAHARAKLREELAVLDHRELKDIGVTDLDTFVAGWIPGRR